MDFLAYINKFELECKKYLYKTNKDIKKIENEISAINQEIRNMKSLFKKPLPIGITAGFMGGSMFGTLIAAMFQTPLWIAYLILMIISIIIGLSNENYQKDWDVQMDYLYKDLKAAHKDKYDKEKVETRLKNLINDIHLCYQYYFYMVKEEDKKKEITINPKDVYESQCRLSTFLHEFYNGDLEEFLNLLPHQQFREELNLRLNSKVRDAKEEAWGYKEPIERPRRRRSNRYCGEYTTAGNLALKR